MGETSDESRNDEDDVLARKLEAVVWTFAKWPEQYKRMKRWRARLDDPVDDVERRRDDFYAFFTAAYHLADWISKDTILSEDVRTAAWNFRHTGTLALAADVTNGFKHLKRNREPEVDAGAHVSLTDGGLFKLDTDPLDVTQLGTFVIAGDETLEDAFDVAHRCIVEWDYFLRTHGLLPATIDPFGPKAK